MQPDETSRDRPVRPTAEAGGEAPVDVVIDPSVAAAIAMHAAGSVPGVVRLEPRMTGLVASLATRARHSLGRGGPAPVDGVVVDIHGATASVHVDLTTAAGAHVATVARHVQAAVAHVLRVDAGLTAAAVSVSVLDIDFPGAAATDPMPGRRP